MQQAAANVDESQFTRIEAIINSMTSKERHNSTIINGSRRKRIALGSGTTVQEVNNLLRQHTQMAKHRSRPITLHRRLEAVLPHRLHRRRVDPRPHPVHTCTSCGTPFTSTTISTTIVPERGSFSFLLSSWPKSRSRIRVSSGAFTSPPIL
jgi:hypothetical protein